MNELQGIPKILHRVRNKLQPFWSLVDMVRMNKDTEPPFASWDLEREADTAYSNTTEIIKALEEVDTLSRKQVYTEDDMKHSWYSGIANNKRMDMVFGEWIEQYNEAKQENSTTSS